MEVSGQPYITGHMHVCVCVCVCVPAPFPPPRCPFGWEAVDVIEHLDEVQSRDTLSLTSIELGSLAVAFS